MAGIKRSREELELDMMDSENRETGIENMQAFMRLMNTIRPGWMQTDKQFRLHIENVIKNIYPQPVPVSLSIPKLVKELGGKTLERADAYYADNLAAKRYRAQHNDEDPPKHRQWVDGAERVVNSYTEDDREMLTSVLIDLGLVPDDE